MCGLTGASSRATIVRAACESMAYQSYDVLRAMEQDVGRLYRNGTDAVLIGETLMRCPDKKAKLEELRAECRGQR